MQIRELILYGYNGKIRHLPFHLGTVNIITGKSASGKSAVGDIIDYCLGGDSCNIADGIVRENVAWYGLLLQFEDEQVFVARKNPDAGQQSTGYCYFEIGKELIVPKECSFQSNANVSGIEEMLSRRIGISENLHTPPEGQSRLPLIANIRHALYYCFQGQGEIATRDFLFHKQSEDFITQAIRDTIPYFLGIVNEEALALENERSILKRKLVIEQRKLEENRALMGGGLQRAISLISEARQVGLLNEPISVNYDDYQSAYSLLQEVMDWKPVSNPSERMDRLTYLQSQLDGCYGDLEELEADLSNAKAFMGDASGYENEVIHQKNRLESIGLFEQIDFRTNFCPLCSAKLEAALPEVDMIKAAISNLDRSIQNVARERPKLRSFIDGLEQERQKKREEIKGIEYEIDGIYNQKQKGEQIKDLNARRALVVGRISLWLESVENDTHSDGQELKISKFKNRIDEINGLLDRDSLEERKQSILSRIQVDMTEWAKELELEYCGNPFRLDLGKVTVIVDKPERPVPLQQLGSGSNWVGVHLITYFALQKFYIGANRPVPNFLFLDQPSQVYFPSELDEKKTDWNKVREMYKFMTKRAHAEKGKLQVIIVDHADLKDKEFRELILEDWHGEKNLVPKEWYQK